MSANGLRIRDAGPGDLPSLLALNKAAVPHVGELTRETAARLFEICALIRAVELAGEPVGFLCAMRPGADYDSPNFLWFKARYPAFLYVDRIMVADSARRLGAGTALYEEAAEFARGRIPLMTCEVNLRPPNPASIAFHERLGFRRVGVQDTCGGTKTVCLMAKNLD